MCVRGQGTRLGARRHIKSGDLRTPRWVELSVAWRWREIAVESKARVYTAVRSEVYMQPLYIYMGMAGPCAMTLALHCAAYLKARRAHTSVRFRAPPGVRGWFVRGCLGGQIYSILFDGT